MSISINKMVTLNYTLKENNAEGQIIEQTPAEHPLQFIYGIGLMLPAFEANLNGLNENDDFTMNLKAVEAYGEFDETAIVELSKDIFIIDGAFDEERFAIGNSVPMQTSNGQRMNGTITSIEESTLTMDFNHPMAGKDLYFEGKIIEVRDATEEEIAAVTGGGCSCGSGGCDSAGSCDSDEGGCGCESGGCGC